MEQRIQKFLAFDCERKQICNVLSITTSDLNGRQNGVVEMNNGHVTFWKNYLKEECILLEYTHYQDANQEDIFEGDLLEDEEHVFKVEWNRNQACWWLNPLVYKKMISDLSDDVFIILANQSLGNGYFHRKDLTKIGNFHTHPHLILQKK